MKPHLLRRPLAAFCLIAFTCSAHGADKYWSPALTGTWDTTTSNWSLTPLGTVNQQWVNADNAFFDQPGTYTVTNNTAGLKAGTINVSAGTVTFDGTGNVKADTIIIAAGSSIVNTVPDRIIRTGATVLQVDGTFDFTGSSNAGYLSTLAGSATGEITSSNSTNNSLRLGGASNFSGNITGTTSLILELGNGSITLSGNNSYSGNTLLRSANGTLTLNSATALSPNTFLRFGTGSNVVELTSGDFSRALGSAGGNVRFADSTGSAGFAAIGADRTVALMGGLTWTNVSGTTFDPSQFILGNANSTHKVTLISNLDLGAGSRIISSTDGSAAIEGEISGVISNGGLTKDGTGTIALTGDNTYTGATTISAGTLQLGNGAIGKDGKIAGTSIVNNANLTFNRFGTTPTYGGVISGSGTVTKLGGGTQTLTGANTYAGGTTVSAGEINFKGTVTNTSSTGTISVATGARVTFTDKAGGVPNVTNNFTLNGSGISGNGALNFFNSGFSTASTGLTGTANLASNTTVRIDANTQTSPIDFRGVISGVGGLTLFNQTASTGTALFKFSQANTYGSGNQNTILTSSAAGAKAMLVELAVADALPTETTVTFGGTPTGASGTFNKNVTLQLDGISQTVAGLAAVGSGTYRIVGNSATASTLIVNNAVNNTFSGVIGDVGSNNNNIALTKTGAGVLTLTGTNTYTGATSINVGSISLEATKAIAAGSAVDVAADAALRIAVPTGTATFSYGFPLTLNGNRGSTSAGLLFPSNNLNTYNMNGTIALNGGGNIYSFGLINNYNLNGVISGTGGLTVTNAGNTNTAQKYVFGAASTYTGDTVLAATTGNTIFQVGVTNALPTSTTLAVNGGSAANYAALSLAGNDQTVAGLSGNVNARIYGANATLSTLTVNNTTAGIFSGTIGGVGSNENNLGLTKTGGGVLTLGGSNTYSGATAVNSGTLLISAGAGIGSSAVTVTGAGTVLASGSTGIIGKSVSVQSGAILAPAGTQGVGKATVGADGITLAGSSIFSWNLAANPTDPGIRGTGYDAINTASLSGTGAIFRVVLNGAEDFGTSFWNADHQWSDIFQTSDGGSALDIASVFTGTIQYYNDSGSIGNFNSGRSFTVDGSNLTWSAVPEPSGALAGILLALGILRRRRA